MCEAVANARMPLDVYPRRHPFTVLLMRPRIVLRLPSLGGGFDRGFVSFLRVAVCACTRRARRAQAVTGTVRDEAIAHLGNEVGPAASSLRRRSRALCPRDRP